MPGINTASTVKYASQKKMHRTVACKQYKRTRGACTFTVKSEGVITYQRAAWGWGSWFSRGNHGYSAVMGTEFTVVPRGRGTKFTVIPWERGDLLRQYRRVGLLIFNVIMDWTVNCELAEFDV